MARLYGATFTLIFILASCFATAHWVDDITIYYIDQLEYAQSLTKENKWQEASDVTQAVYDHWNGQSFSLYVLLRHGDIDKISLGFQSVSQYLQQEDEEPYTANNAQLITQLRLLAEMEQLSLENIL